MGDYMVVLAKAETLRLMKDYDGAATLMEPSV